MVMTTSAARIRSYSGPALFSYGFRPFFLFGALWSALAVSILLPALEGSVSIPSVFPPTVWHQHEMIFGYVPAIVAGFLLTAVPNWTGRLPVVGVRLAALFAIWIAGRIAVFVSALIGAHVAAAIDLAFLATLGAVVAREIVAANNGHNLKVLGILAVLFGGNAAFHAEVLAGMPQGIGARVGIAATIMLICVIGGRIVPSFTRNWLVKRAPGALPVPFSSFDVAAMLITGAALVSWVALPEHTLTASLAILAMIANAHRLARWAGYRTAGEPLVLVLHVAFAFVPLGFGLMALAGFAPSLVLPSGAVHGWTIGAIGLMTLAVMTRASLGHTGQPLAATPAIASLYVAVVVAAVARTLAAFDVLREVLLPVSATAWIVGFAGFVVIFAPLLMRRRA